MARAGRLHDSRRAAGAMLGVLGMNRREFARGVMAGAAGLALGKNAWSSGTHICQSQADMGHHHAERATENAIELGIQLYSVRDECQRDLPGTLKALRDMGYGEVEFFTFYGKTAAEIGRLLADTGLRCRSAHYHYPVLAGELDREIDYASVLGLHYMVSAWIPEELRKTRDDYVRIAETLNRAAEQCRKAGIQLLYHNHNFEFRSFEGQTAFDLLMKNTEPSIVRLEIDCYWMAAAGVDPVSYLSSPSRCSLLHIKDRKSGYKPTVEMNEGTAPFAVLGKGAIEYGRILTAAKNAGVKLAYIDQDACDGDPMMCADESRAAWSRVR